MQKALLTSNKEYWETPLWVIRWLEDMNGDRFGLDVAATERNAKARRWMDKGLDALSVGSDWVQASEGELIFMNPPYGRKIGDWILKAFEASMGGAHVTCLLPSRTDTSWFHDMVTEGDVILCRGRIAFELGGDKQDAAPFPSLIVRFGAKYPRGIRTADLRRVEAEYT